MIPGNRHLFLDQEGSVPYERDEHEICEQGTGEDAGPSAPMENNQVECALHTIDYYSKKSFPIIVNNNSITRKKTSQGRSPKFSPYFLAIKIRVDLCASADSKYLSNSWKISSRFSCPSWLKIFATWWKKSAKIRPIRAIFVLCFPLYPNRINR